MTKTCNFLIFALAIGFALWAMTACVAATPLNNNKEVVGDRITRWTDEEAGVVCWIYNAGYAGGISCLPISETLIGRE
jgi:hypothetical protein